MPVDFLVLLFNDGSVERSAAGGSCIRLTGQNLYEALK